METMSPLRKTKAELTNLANLIHSTRIEHKEVQRSTKGSGLEGKLHDVVQSFRNLHIAYCLVRGRTYEQIETNVREGNSPRWDSINSMKDALNRDQLAWRAARDLEWEQTKASHKKTQEVVHEEVPV